MALVEPLLAKLRELTKVGQPNALKRATSLYGDHADLELLLRSIASSQEETKGVPVVDLSPMLAIGTDSRLKELLIAHANRTFVLVVRDTMAGGPALTSVLATWPSMVLDQKGKIRIHSPGFDGAPEPVAEVARQFPVGSHFQEIRARVVEEEMRRLASGATRLPPTGRKYISLSDDTSANLWLDVKVLLKNPDTAFRLAYHAGYALTEGYTKDIPEDGFLVGNNASYVFGCHLQQIFGDKELYVIDRLGPFPHLSRLRFAGYEDQVRGKRFCVVEDVISTCREIDLIALSAFYLGGSVTRAIALFDFQVASSLLLKADQIVALCRPAESLGYARTNKLASGEVQ